MYCPTCGNESSLDQKFCRACGMNLQSTSDAVAQHTHQVIDADWQREKRVERWGRITGLIGVVIIVLLIVSALTCVSISKIFGLNFDNFGFDYIAPVVVSIGLLTMILAAALLSYPKLKGNGSGSRSDKAKSLVRATSTEMPSLAEPLSSVTENTTRTLDTSNPTTSVGVDDKLRV